MLAIVMRENMKLGDNTMNYERQTFVNTKISAKILANCSPYFTALQYINNLETNRSYKRKANLQNPIFFKISIERLKNYSPIC